MALFKKFSELVDNVKESAMNSLNINQSAQASNSNTTSAAVPPRNPLETPPPPAVPVFESLSVMVAVNGKSYGPYEKATLQEMIGNGSLTSDTYVFIKGMPDWKRACEVPQVAVLLASHAPAPAAPPMPWANSSTDQPAQTANAAGASDNPFSPRLNQLITAAVADGEISDLERQVLIRNAQQEGVQMDEFVMVLEARLYEQRRVLAAQEEEKANRAKALAAQQQAAVAAAQAAARPAAPAQASPAQRTKCSHCGAPIKALTTICPECGHDYMMQAQKRQSAWDSLSEQIQNIMAQPEPKKKKPGLFEVMLNPTVIEEQMDPNKSKNDLIVKAINGCAIPTDKNEIVDFMVACAPLGTAPTGVFSQITKSDKAVVKAYYQKAQQVVLKARIVLKNEPDLLQQIESIAKQYKIKV